MKRIGFVESNRSGSGFDALRAARKLGLHVTFFSCGLDRYHATPGGTEVLRTCVDEVVYCQTHELAPLLAAVKEVDATQPLDALLSVAEYEVVQTAEVARQLGLPGPDPDAVRIARNKADQRRRWAERGVPIPAFRAVTTAEQAAQAAEEIGLPCRGKAGRRDQRGQCRPVHDRARGDRRFLGGAVRTDEPPRSAPASRGARRGMPGRLRGQRGGSGRGRIRSRARGDRQAGRGRQPVHRARTQLPDGAAGSDPGRDWKRPRWPRP